jgi:putative spermidine/putrescine transport system ATP-binding protein
MSGDPKAVMLRGPEPEAEPATPATGAEAEPAPPAAGAQAGAETAVRLRVRGLRKTYGAVVALDSADLDVRQGEFLTLLGPSGSGKTTLLMMVAGLLYPDGGEVSIEGTVATYAPPNKRDIGMVFQNYALFPHMSVQDNVAFPLRMRNLPEKEIRAEVARALEIVRLPDMARRKPAELSGGQQQRIALARCLVYRPPIILMDEPLGALDKGLRDQLQLEIRDLHRRTGVTIVYVTHDQEEALVMSDRICLMKDGRIEQLGSPGEVYFRPDTLFAAGFLGESNILQGRVRHVSGGRATLELAGARVDLAARGDLSVGRSVPVMIRPENARVLPPGEETGPALEATLEDVIMVGQVTKYFAVLADGARVKATALTAGPTARFAPGDPVRIGFDPTAATMIPDRKED